MLQILFYRWDHRSVLHSLMKKMQWLYAYRFRRLYRVFDQIVSPSTRIAGLLAQRYPFISTGVLRNPVQGVEKLRNLQPRSISSSPLRLVFAGRLSQEKNILAFLKLFLQLGSQGVVLDIIGDGPEEPAIHELLSERDTRHQVNLLGRLTHPELMEKLPQYHALVLCSLNETAPLSIVEAALSGIRVLTLPRFGMKEMGDICGGTVYFEMNPQSLQQSLTDLSAAAQQSLPVVRNIEDIIDTFSRTSYKMQLLQYYRTSNNQGF